MRTRIALIIRVVDAEFLRLAKNPALEKLVCANGPR
jgi:hypothetical protein